MITNKISEYGNGNCVVKIFEDGSKIRQWPEGEIAAPKFPESIDLKITNHCSGGSESRCMAHCFTPDSSVLTIKGNLAISKLKIGDAIYSFNIETKQLELDIVDNILLNAINDSVLEIELENGKVVRCTPDHLFYTQNRGWVRAIDLNINDDIFNII